MQMSAMTATAFEAMLQTWGRKMFAAVLLGLCNFSPFSFSLLVATGVF